MRYLVFAFFIILWVFAAKAQYVNPYATGSTKNMVLIKGNTFWMGIDSAGLNKDLLKYPDRKEDLLTEYPHFRVLLRDFYLDKYQVTNADYRKFIKANPQWSKERASRADVDSNYLKDWKSDKYPKGKDKFPVVYVSWNAAKAYANWAGKRLPMEVEMEYASEFRGTTAPEYPWGDMVPDSLKANYSGSGITHPTAIGKYPPNYLDLYDLAGNVWEFCADQWWAQRHSHLTHSTEDVVIKGGSFNSQAFDLRVTRRSHCTKEACLPDVGFRCAMNYIEKK